MALQALPGGAARAVPRAGRRAVSSLTLHCPRPVFRLGHRPALDGLRGCAILAVMLTHTLPAAVPGASFGVDVFFVLSGFLITALLLQECQATGSISLRHFYLRRALHSCPSCTSSCWRAGCSRGCGVRPSTLSSPATAPWASCSISSTGRWPSGRAPTPCWSTPGRCRWRSSSICSGRSFSSVCCGCDCGGAGSSASSWQRWPPPSPSASSSPACPFRPGLGSTMAQIRASMPC